MHPEEIIRHKRDGHQLSRRQIEYFINGLVSGEVADYQGSAWAMAVYFQGMTPQETADLALAMAHSGEVMDLSAIAGIKVDKHSTGGVGDKTTPVVVALCAAAGVPVAKLSGRGLGFTGGTIDKFESIPGFRTEMNQKDFFAQVNRIKAAVIAQSGNLVPADKILYGLRDVTATVDSIPLIASSVMSKKIASGADGIVLDIKVGRGAFMKTVEEAVKLAHTMVAIGTQAGRRVAAILSDMEKPLGYAVGNRLEIQEAVDLLRGQGPQDLEQLCLALSGRMILLGGAVSSLKDADSLARHLLDEGHGYTKLAEMVEAQGGRVKNLERIADIDPASLQVEVKSPRAGYITGLKTDEIGRAVMALGAGREQSGQKIDHSVGLILHKKTGDLVETGDVLVTIHANDPQKLEMAKEQVLLAMEWGESMPLMAPIILEVVDG
ncbi:MAG: thymidine phosphorylase [Syntrophomonadaceae bacterium]|nr:thymidine phosphorylase [Syntrophomonadaceae bacterium]